jgi:cell wall-associated NlpC family hydrolase
MADSAELIAKAISYALAQVGDPYVNTPPGANPPTSWDCSKLTTWAWSIATGGSGYSGGSIQLTPYTYTQVNECVRIPGVSPSNGANGLQQGDLLFYFENNAHHVTMYIGNGRLVHAGSPVQTQDLWTPWNIQHFTTAARPPGIGVVGDLSDPLDGGTDDKEDKSNQRVVKTTRSVGKNAVALSGVYGTTQTARFAAMNLSNETVFLNAEGYGELLNGADNGLLQIVANTIIPGDQYELKKLVPGGRNSYEITIDTESVQSESQAEAVASMISRSFSYQYKSIEVRIFGNPLIQIGDIVKFNFYSGKVTSGTNDYYIVTRVKHDFEQGLSTTLTIKPLIETVSVV